MDLVAETLAGYLIGPIMLGAITFAITWGALRWNQRRKEKARLLYQHRLELEIGNAIDRWEANPNNVVEMEEISGCRHLRK